MMTGQKNVISAYPLQWPTGWHRTESAYRTRARFTSAARESGRSYTTHRDLTITQGRERVLAQLQLMGLSLDDVVISTNLRLRLDGLPRGDQGEPRDPGVAVYWEEAANKRRVIAIDRYDRVAGNLGAIAATLDAMRAIERHGSAEILERAFTGFTALPPPGSATGLDWRVVLELTELPQPCRADVDSAYRRLASQHHPDRGGDPARMAAINMGREQALAWLEAQR